MQLFFFFFFVKILKYLEPCLLRCPPNFCVLKNTMSSSQINQRCIIGNLILGPAPVHSCRHPCREWNYLTVLSRCAQYVDYATFQKQNKTKILSLWHLPLDGRILSVRQTVSRLCFRRANRYIYVLSVYGWFCGWFTLLRGKGLPPWLHYLALLFMLVSLFSHDY